MSTNNNSFHSHVATQGLTCTVMHYAPLLIKSWVTKYWFLMDTWNQKKNRKSIFVLERLECKLMHTVSLFHGGKNSCKINNRQRTIESETERSKINLFIHNTISVYNLFWKFLSRCQISWNREKAISSAKRYPKMGIRLPRPVFEPSWCSEARETASNGT